MRLRARARIELRKGQTTSWRDRRCTPYRMAEPQPFRVELSWQATRAFEALPAADQSRVAKALDALEREPRPRGKR